LSSAAADLQCRFRSGECRPLDILRERMATGTLDMDTAMSCTLELSDSITQAPRSERLLRIQPTNETGGQILNWLWQREERWVPVFTQVESDKFQQTLCLLLAAEGLDDYVIRLIDTRLPQDASDQVPLENVHRWRGYVLRSVIRAYLAWDTRRSADAALDLFEKVSKRRLLAKRCRGADHNPIATVRLLSSLSQIRDSICSGQFVNTSVGKSERLIAHFEALQLVELPVFLAQLHLHHPTKPKADHFFALCKQDSLAEVSTAVRDALKEHPKFKTMLTHHSLRASAVLRIRGRSDEAQWLDEYTTAALGTLKVKYHKSG
jgi:hypothetical protein